MVYCYLGHFPYQNVMNLLLDELTHDIVIQWVKYTEIIIL